MDTLKDKILGFVKAQSEPVLISAIAKGVGCELAEAQKAVLELRREGVLFRSLSNGKALISANSKNGEGLTPVQEGHARVARTLDAALGRGPASATDSADGADDGSRSPFDIKLSFSQGKTLQFKDYSIGIPDGFVYKTDVNGRDFAIWMPSPEGSNADELDVDGVPIMTPVVLKENAFKSPSEALSMLNVKKTYAYAMTSGLLQKNILKTVPEILDTQNIAAYYYRGLMSNYEVRPLFNHYVKSFSLKVDPEIDPEDDSKDPGRINFNAMLSAWIDTVKLSEPYPTRKSLDDPEFFNGGITKAAITKWREYAVGWANQHTALCTMAIQYEVHKYNATHSAWSFTACKPTMLSYLKEEAANYNKMLAEALNCVNRLNGTCPDDVFLLLGKQALEFATMDSCSRQIDADEIAVETDAPQVRAKIKEMSLPIEEKVKATEHSRKEAKISEPSKKPKKTPEQKKDRAEPVRKTLEQELKEEQAKLDPFIKEMETEREPVRKQYEEAERELAGLGFFSFSRKKELRERLAALKASMDAIQAKHEKLMEIQKKKVGDLKKLYDTLQIVVEHGPLTCSEVYQKNPALFTDVIDASGTLRKLQERQELIQTERRGKGYYNIPDKSQT